jgi:hydrogenase maturation protease
MSRDEAVLRSAGGEPRILVLGYGNPGRQDDGLGPAVAAAVEQMRWQNVTAYDNYQLNIEDAAEVAQHDVVWFVDAARTGPEPFYISNVVPASGIEFTSHNVRPEVVLAIARQYYGRSPTAFLLGVRGYAFEFVEELTTGAADNLRAAFGMLSDRIRAAGDGT